MRSIRFFCPDCHQGQVVNHLNPGEHTHCRNCTQIMVVPEEDGVTAVAVEKPSKDGPPVTPSPILIQNIQAELKQLEHPQSNLGRSLAILLVSVLAFVGFVSIGNTFEFVIMLVVVLLIHELGHLVGMKLFGYKDVQMLFIPFLGAAVSGHDSDPRAGRRAVVTLMGPVPGILIGVILAPIAVQIENPTLHLYAETSIFLNLFNLLPLYPLDGGRILQHALFTRYPRLRLVFQAITVVLFGLLAYFAQSIALGVFALLMLISVAATRIDVRAQRILEQGFGPASPDLTSDIPEEQLTALTASLLTHQGIEPDKPKPIAIIARRVWATYREKPPGVWAAAGILLLYSISLIVGTVATVAMSAPA